MPRCSSRVPPSLFLGQHSVDGRSCSAGEFGELLLCQGDDCRSVPAGGWRLRTLLTAALGEKPALDLPRVQSSGSAMPSKAAVALGDKAKGTNCSKSSRRCHPGCVRRFSRPTARLDLARPSGLDLLEVDLRLRAHPFLPRGRCPGP